MNPIIASLICACGIAGLFYLNRDKTVHTSKALWIPVTYVWIMGSRSVSEWLNPAQGFVVADSQAEGSPVDAAFFGVLLVAAIAVLIHRKRRSRILLGANWPIVIYFVYCLLSVTWSVHPDIAFKRWIKSTIDIAMVLVVITDVNPVAAIKRLISRAGLILLPTSLLFLKYFPVLGRSFTADGIAENTGVTTNKNVFGLVILLISLGTLWQIIDLVRARGRANRGRLLIAQGVLLTFGIVLFRWADSATSLACFFLSAGLMLVTNLRAFRGRSGRVHAVCAVLLLVCVFTFLVTGSDDIAKALGRKSNLSGRTDIWAALIPTVPNAIVGAGFESYWISSGPDEAWAKLSKTGWWHPEILVTEAHDGYVEIYLNLGWVGVGLIAFVLITGYKRAISALRRNPSIGGLALAYLLSSIFYSITEAGFRSLNPMWMFLLLAIVTSTGVTVGFFSESPTRRHIEVQRATAVDSGGGREQLVPEPEEGYVFPPSAPTPNHRWSQIATRFTASRERL